VLPSASVYLYAYASSKVVDGDMRYRRYSMGMWSKGSRHPQACAYLGRPASERNPVAPRACSSRIRGYGRACLSSVVSSEGIARIAAENRILHGSSLATRPTWAWPDRDKPQIPTRWFWRFVSSSWCRAMPCSRGWPGVR
jgi:hypothetical protein